MMRSASLLLFIAAAPACAKVLLGRGASLAFDVCDPESDVCHGCEQICSQYADDDKLLLSTKCLAECQADCYNCLEGTLPKEELEGGEEECIKGKLLDRIKSDGDLVLKIVYDVPPGFKEFDQLYEEDGKIDHRDMDVAFDLLDGGASPDGTTIPTSKVQVVWEVFREADQDGDGIVTEAEFEAYDNNQHMGEHIEDLHPTPESKDLAAIQVEDTKYELLDAKPLPKKDRHARRGGHSPNRAKKHDRARLAYFQHLLRLGLRVWRAEERKEHPISNLAHKIGMSVIKHPRPAAAREDKVKK